MKIEVVKKYLRPYIKELFFEFYEDINTVRSTDQFRPIRVSSKTTWLDYFNRKMRNLLMVSVQIASNAESQPR